MKRRHLSLCSMAVLALLLSGQGTNADQALMRTAPTIEAQTPSKEDPKESPEEAESEEDEEQGDEDTDPAVDEPLQLATQVVTGSRLAKGDPSAWVYSLSSEEIAARGIFSLEELFRVLPWNLSTINTQTNTSSTGIRAEDTDQILGELGLGASTINLRALGSANTLILVNGRRVAGLAGNEDNYANILHVPLSAVERVDIQLDGASAVYGADAIGGAVNFILKKRFQGYSAQFRREFSSTDADTGRLSLGTGYSWGGGNLSARLSRTRTSPVTNAKTGWTTNDYREQYGPEYDLRSGGFGQPGVACEMYAYYGDARDFLSPFCASTLRYQLPAGHSGLGATVEEFSTELGFFDHVAPRNGADSTHESFLVNIEQNLTDSLFIFADLQYSKLDSRQETATVLSQVLVPDTNAYNPFGKHMVVSYWPAAEIEAGLVPRSSLQADSKQRNYSLGFNWKRGRQELELRYSNSMSKRFAWRSGYDPSRPEGDPTQEKFYAALESSDPSKALNLFGDGSAQQTELLAEMLTHENGRRGFTRRTTVEALLRGRLFRIWGGDVDYAAGMSLRKDAIYYGLEWYTAESGLRTVIDSEAGIGVERPTFEYKGYFAEINFPIFGEDNAWPGLRSLILSLQARRDIYISVGTFGRDSELELTPRRAYVPGQGWQDTQWNNYMFNFTSPRNLGEVEQGATSPRLGLYYKPIEDLMLRASWSRSFRPPVFSDIFSVSKPRVVDGPVWDSGHPSGEFRFYFAETNYADANPGLEAEYSDNYSLGLEWSPSFVSGLHWTVNWSRIEFTNRIQRTDWLLYNTPYDQQPLVYSIPEIAERDDATGNITRLNFTRINLAEKVSEVVTTELQYAFSTRFGTVAPRLGYYRVLEESNRIAAQFPSIDRAGTSWGSVPYRITGTLSLLAGRFALNAFAYFTPRYENELVGRCAQVVGRCTRVGEPRPPLPVGSLTTVDLTASYKFDSGLLLRVGGRNVFDAKAPTIWNGLPYNPTRWDARGQVFFLETNWEF